MAGTGKGDPPSLICSCPPPAPGWSEALAADGARKTGAQLPQPPKGKGKHTRPRQDDEETARAARGPFRDGKSRTLEQEAEEQLAKEWEGVKLAKELTAEKRLEREDEEEDPDRSMKLSFPAQTYDFGGPGVPLPQGWSPSSREDSAEAGLPLPVRSYPEEKKEEEGSANRRPEVGVGREEAPGQASRRWARLRGQPHPRAAPALGSGHGLPGVWDWRGTLTGGPWTFPWRPGFESELGKGRGKGVSDWEASEPRLAEGTQESGSAGRQETRSDQISVWKLEAWDAGLVPGGSGWGLCPTGNVEPLRDPEQGEGMTVEPGALEGESLETEGPSRDWPLGGPSPGHHWPQELGGHERKGHGVLGRPCSWSSQVPSWTPDSSGTSSSPKFKPCLPPSVAEWAGAGPPGPLAWR